MRKDFRFPPSDLGDGGVRHEVNVFVYRAGAGGPEYLLLRPSRQPDSLWRPVVSAIGHDEDLVHAALTAVREQIGLTEAFDLLCPAPGVEEAVGDLQLIGWPVGFRLRRRRLSVRPRDGASQTDWMDFRRALHELGLSVHRQNLLQLHWGTAA